MPEGHSIHRLAGALERGFGGQRVRTSSPQGRFPEAAQLDGWVLTGTEAAGKHLLLAFAPEAGIDAASPVTRFVHVHLGLYGSWTFAGEPGFALAPSIGAPRVRPGQAVRVGEQEHAAAPRATGEAEAADDAGAADDAEAVADADNWRYSVPRPTTRLRIVGKDGLADLTGPTACEIYDHTQREALLARLGPDPLREDADPERFVGRVLGSRTAIGTLLMNQDVISGVGNIYRAEALFRARLDPFVPGKDLTAGMVRGIWDDLAPLMRYGVATGRIVTTQPEHREIEARIIERGGRPRGADGLDGDPAVVPREESFYVYHRQTLPCRICATTIRSADMAGRTVFWCPRCQSVRSRRARWSIEHSAAAWATADPAGDDRRVTW